MPLLSDQGLRTDVRAAERVIRDVVGVDPKPWFRLPFGTGESDSRVLGCLSSLGYRHVGWDVDVQEWRPRRSSRVVARRVAEGAEARGDGAIVLLHTWPTPVGALPAILGRLRDIGAEFVRLDELPAPAVAG